jgi:hypothetical protein
MKLTMGVVTGHTAGEAQKLAATICGENSTHLKCSFLWWPMISCQSNFYVIFFVALHNCGMTFGGWEPNYLFV